ncbi:MAG: nickel pincer cofactor biosynthesis protein LarB [Chlorobi bacterium]|nr:nickel pincer cofactor biosynthesis protein LarB [Chlorobiota bacterium]
MSSDHLHTILTRLQKGSLFLDEAYAQINQLTRFVETDTAMVDTDREARCGIPEVVYCEAKSSEQIIEVIDALYDRHGLAFGTRCSPEKAEHICRQFDNTGYHELSRTIRVGAPQKPRTTVVAGVISAGTSDLPVAEEAAQTLETFGAPVRRVVDVGVAGLHRLLAHQSVLAEAGVLIVVAGMEGALPSVVGGLTPQPVIAVPTSVGYGASLAGITPLLAMLTSCASGISVVNIDNGFGAAAAALRILKGSENDGVPCNV